MDRFGRSLRFCHLDIDEEAISDGFIAHYLDFKGDRKGAEF